MDITPISSVSGISSATMQTTAKTSSVAGNTFSNMLSDLMSNVNETEKASANDIYGIVSGNTDNLHQVLINSEKAEIAISLVVQVRNKLLDSYNEIMNISI